MKVDFTLKNMSLSESEKDMISSKFQKFEKLGQEGEEMRVDLHLERVHNEKNDAISFNVTTLIHWSRPGMNRTFTASGHNLMEAIDVAKDKAFENITQDKQKRDTTNMNFLKKMKHSVLDIFGR